MRNRWLVRLSKFGVVDGERYDRDTGTTVLKKAAGTPLCVHEKRGGLHHPSDEATARCLVDPDTVVGVIREAWIEADGAYGVAQFVGEPGWLRAWLVALERRGMLEEPEAPGLSIRGRAMRAPEADGAYGVAQFVGEPGWLRAWLVALERRGMLEEPEAPGLSIRGRAMRAPEADGTHTIYLTRLDAVEIVEAPRRDGRFLRSFMPYRPEDLSPVRLRLPDGEIELRG